MKHSKYKISLISLHTPTIENKGGASALPYHLINFRPKEFDIEIFSFNLNKINLNEIKEIENNLNVKITLLKTTFLVTFLRSKFGLVLRPFLSLPVLAFLKLPKKLSKLILNNSDFLWIYGEDISHFAKEINLPSVITTPDCEALYYKRILDLPSKLSSFWEILRYGNAYSQYLNLERSFKIKNTIYHLVGEEDSQFLNEINPALKVCFIRHPHYEGNIDRHIDFSNNKLKIIIPGRYDFYTKEAIDFSIDAIKREPSLKDYYVFTFQGKNWEKPASLLKDAGFEVNLKGFVPVYKDELCLHDIQLSPIAVGTGTKGKVLDAFINGLLVIGTQRAIDNIDVFNTKDFCLFSNKHDLIQILFDIAHNKIKYQEIARSGKEKVIESHGINKIANQFYSLFDIAANNN